jgi:hypothetical protein
MVLKTQIFLTNCLIFFFKALKWFQLRYFRLFYFLEYALKFYTYLLAALFNFSLIKISRKAGSKKLAYKHLIKEHGFLLRLVSSSNIVRLNLFNLQMQKYSSSIQLYLFLYLFGINNLKFIQKKKMSILQFLN